MPGQQDDAGSDMSWEDIWQKVSGKGGGGAVNLPVGKVLGALVAIVVVIWLLSGIYTVGPGEQGVVKQFGEHVTTTDPGLNYHLPSPIQTVTKVNMEEIRTADIGFRRLSNDDRRVEESEALMLTGDENIVDAEIAIQYKVKDAADFLFNVLDPETVLHTSTEVALRTVVGRNDIDFVLTDGRSLVQSETFELLQKLLDDYGSGLEITLAELQRTGPPEDVSDSFNEVNRAREDRDRLVREAEGYAADRVPKARGVAEETILGSQAYKQQRVLEAEGDAAKFLKILREHEVPAAFQALADDGVAEAITVMSQLGFVRDDADDEGEIASMSRETLRDILVGLGAVDADLLTEDLTSLSLYSAMALLGIAGDYEAAYLEAIELTRERLYFETMEDVLTDTEKIIVDPQMGGSLMPFLPLKELTGVNSSEEDN